jgi:pSer/pThr/pTyr-binding forkhead associated (FHA) protein
MAIVLEPLSETSTQTIPVEGPRFLIGRAQDCDLRLPNPLVSRRHAEVISREDATFVRDLASRNGTFVNGEPVSQERELHDGDVLGVAMLQFRVAMEGKLARRLRGYFHVPLGASASPERDDA